MGSAETHTRSAEPPMARPKCDQARPTMVNTAPALSACPGKPRICWIHPGRARVRSMPPRFEPSLPRTQPGICQRRLGLVEVDRAAPMTTECGPESLNRDSVRKPEHLPASGELLRVRPRCECSDGDKHVNGALIHNRPLLGRMPFCQVACWLSRCVSGLHPTNNPKGSRGSMLTVLRIMSHAMEGSPWDQPFRSRQKDGQLLVEVHTLRQLSVSTKPMDRKWTSQCFSHNPREPGCP